MIINPIAVEPAGLAVQDGEAGGRLSGDQRHQQLAKEGNHNETLHPSCSVF